MTDNITLRKAAQQALEALENHEGNYKLGRAGCERQEAVITAIKEALAQPLQQAEPSQWRDMVVVNLVREGVNKHKARELADHFAAPPQQYDEDEVLAETARYRAEVERLNAKLAAMNEIQKQHSPTFMGEPKV